MTDKTRLSAFEACLSEIVFVFERTNKRHHRATQRSAPCSGTPIVGVHAPEKTPTLRLRLETYDSCTGDHPHVAKSYFGLGNVYNRQGQYERALEYYHKALEIDIKVSGQDHLDVAKTRENMAIIYQNQGLYDQALEIYKSVLETKIRVCGHDSPDVCDSFYNLACAHATRDSMLCRDMLLKAEQTGFLHLLKEHMKTDSDLDAVRELEWCKELVGRLY